MEISIWVVAAVATRCLAYCGMAILVAIPALLFISRHSYKLPLRTYALIAAPLAVLACVVYFFIQVGALSESGWLGMFDTVMLDIMWQSGHGIGLVYQLVSIALLFSLSLFDFCALPMSHYRKVLKILFYGIALIILGLSFSTTGHIATLPTWVKPVLGLHVLLALWWIGSLLPLAQACDRLESVSLHQLMHNFGRVAMFVVIVLCALGVTLGLQLVGSVELLLSSRYGQMVLLKVLCVGAILSLAALHRWRRVPALLQGMQEQSHKALAYSIKWELFVGLMILLLTAVLTSTMGPK